MASRMYCSTCGCKLISGAEFCGNCGSIIPTEAPGLKTPDLYSPQNSSERATPGTSYVPEFNGTLFGSSLGNRDSSHNVKTLNEDEAPKQHWYQTLAPNLAIGAVLVVADALLTAVKSGPFPFTLKSGPFPFTLLELCRLNSARDILVCFGVISIVAPFAHIVWKERVAFLGGLLPILFNFTVFVKFYNQAQDSMATDSDVLSGVSFGVGFYLSAIASFCFAVISIALLMDSFMDTAHVPEFDGRLFGSQGGGSDIRHNAVSFDENEAPKHHRHRIGAVSLLLCAAAALVLGIFLSTKESPEKATSTVASTSNTATREARIEPSKTFTAIVSCGVSGFENINVQGCFTEHDLTTELELTNGGQYGLYKVYNLDSLGETTSDGLRIRLQNHFEIKAQNASSNLTLGIRIYEDQTGQQVLAKQVAQYGVIRASN